MGTSADKFIQLPPNLDAPIFQMQIGIKRYFQRINSTLAKLFMRALGPRKGITVLCKFYLQIFSLIYQHMYSKPTDFFVALFLKNPHKTTFTPTWRDSPFSIWEKNNFHTWPTVGMPPKVDVFLFVASCTGPGRDLIGAAKEWKKKRKEERKTNRHRRAGIGWSGLSDGQATAPSIQHPTPSWFII